MKIPATIVTGFLGAGKTTMLTHLLSQASTKGKKLGFLINEFGDLGIDGDIVKNCGIPGCESENVIELANGCICCTVADDFLPAMRTLLDRSNPPDHIIIETSGLALPKPLLKAFGWPDIKARATIDGVIAIIDGPAAANGRFADNPQAIEKMRQSQDVLDHDNPIAELFSDQVNCADLIILNKTDQMSTDDLISAKAEVEKVSTRKVKILVAQFGKLDSKILLGLSAEAESDLESRPSIHEQEGEDHDHDDFSSFHLDLPPFDSVEQLLGKLKAIANKYDILRIKGFAAIKGKEMRLLVQGVGPRFSHHFDRPWQSQEKPMTRVVFIGLNDLDQLAITNELAR